MNGGAEPRSAEGSVLRAGLRAPRVLEDRAVGTGLSSFQILLFPEQWSGNG